ncbi:MAG: patatin-like phospholipase family protein [Candidatus Melainabacteria bacterium]|nr:patatin-like phospholipase family protein [Candidatus Melainabacteria bacterium]
MPKILGLSTAKPKIGLALGGGGARGAAHVGVLKVLEREGIKFDYVTGTSIGAVIGGFYCLGIKPERMEKPVLKAQVMRKFYDVPLSIRLLTFPLSRMSRFFGVKSYDGLYRGRRFNKYLLAGMSPDQQSIENLPIPFAAVSFNLLDGKPYLIRKGNLATAMMASCAVPSLRRPIEIEGQLMVDGGVGCNLPVKQCRELGAEFVIAVNIDESFEHADPDVFRATGSIARRMLTWALSEMDRPQVYLADVVIHPDTTGISLISTKKSDARRAMLAGEQAAEAALPVIVEKLKQRRKSEN